jgi:hypothetical protein
MVAPEKRRKISKPGQLNIVGDEDEESVHTTVQMVQNMALQDAMSSPNNEDQMLGEIFSEDQIKMNMTSSSHRWTLFWQNRMKNRKTGVITWVITDSYY